MMGMIYTLFADHEDDDDYVEDYDELEVWPEALSPLLTWSFVPFWRSGRVTHAKVIG